MLRDFNKKIYEKIKFLSTRNELNILLAEYKTNSMKTRAKCWLSIEQVSKTLFQDDIQLDINSIN